MEEGNQRPFNLSLMKVNYVPPMMSKDLTLLFMLDGNMTVTIGEKEYQLESDDLLVVNPLHQYQMKSSDKNLLLYLRISRKPITTHFKENWLPYIDCSSSGLKDTEKFQQLRVLLAHLSSVYFKQRGESELEIYQQLFSLLNYLVKEFKKDLNLIPQFKQETTDKRINQLLTQIQKEYESPLSLELFSKTSGMSYYHLSRLFKKQVGTTFTDYINQVRLMRATEALLLTTDSVIQIAMNAGFSSPEIFHRVFKKQHGLTPSNYRKKYSLTKIQDNQTLKSRKYQEISGASALQELAKYLVGKDIEDENTAIEQRMKFTITKASNPMYQSSKKIIKIGPASEGLAGGVQRELHILREELAFDFVQFEGFCEETNFENNVMLVSEYILNNQWFDFLIKIQLKPIIQLFLPEDCIDKKNVQFWCDKQIKIIRHFLNRYGYEEVGQWYVQWSLPKNNNRWSEESRWGYHYFYRKLKRLIPSFKIGLMSLRSLSETEYKQYEEFIEEQSKYHCLPDFISFHADPYVTSTVKDKYALDFKDYQKKLITRVKSVVSKYAKSKIQDFSNWEPEIFLTEWNTLVGEGNTFSGTFFRSALILESIVELSKEVTGIAFWLNIKVKERQSHKREDSSLSVFFYGILRRPLFFSLRFLNHLKGEIVTSGSGYILTQNQGQYQLLLYNSSYLDPLYSVDTFQVRYQMKKIKVHLEGLRVGEYLIREYVLDKDHGGIYNDWIRIGGQAELDGELQSYLEQKIIPKFELRKELITADGYEFDTTLSLNACQLYLFQPLY